MALDFTLLTKAQVWGDDDGNGKLDVIQEYGNKVAPTDLANLLGCYMMGKSNYTSEGDRTCEAWTMSSSYKQVSVVQCDGSKDSSWADMRQTAVRPVLSVSETSKITPDVIKKGVNGIDIVEYGEYPQTVVDKETNAELERLYKEESLKSTGKVYTFDSTDYEERDTRFCRDNCPEYEYNGEKYIRVWPRYNDSEEVKLSNGEYPNVGEHYWVRVEPIEWLKDPTGTWVSKKCLIAGIQFDRDDGYEGDFSKTFMKRYLDEYFAKEIGPSQREIAINGLKKHLEEITNVENAKKTVKEARTPERTETLARIVRIRRARDILAAAAQKAQKVDDQKMLQEIVELAKPYAAREIAIRNKFNLKRAERRSKGGRE